jgi:hypothetical protein
MISHLRGVTQLQMSTWVHVTLNFESNPQMIMVNVEAGLNPLKHIHASQTFLQCTMELSLKFPDQTHGNPTC